MYVIRLIFWDINQQQLQRIKESLWNVAWFVSESEENGYITITVGNTLRLSENVIVEKLLWFGMPTVNYLIEKD